MADPFIGEIRIFSFPFAPMGWAFCNGQTLQIQQNTALFAILGSMYGGDGQRTFALPDLQARAPMQWGAGPGLTPRRQAETGGAKTVTITPAQMPSHSHGFVASGVVSNSLLPTGDVIARPIGRGNNLFAKATQPMVPMDASAVTPTGGSQPHNNMQPSLAVNYCIALEGVFPVRS